MSGALKLGALCATCPYQAICSRIQMRPSASPLRGDAQSHPRANLLSNLLSNLEFNRAAGGILGTGAHAPSHRHFDDCAHVSRSSCTKTFSLTAQARCSEPFIQFPMFLMIKRVDIQRELV